MKKIILVAFLMLAISTQAQDIKMELGKFSKIKVSQGLKVTLTEAKENKAIITGTNRKKVKLLRRMAN